MSQMLHVALTLSCGLALGGVVGYQIGRFVESIKWARRDARFLELAKQQINSPFPIPLRPRRPVKEQTKSQISN